MAHSRVPSIRPSTLGVSITIEFIVLLYRISATPRETPWGALYCVQDESGFMAS
ncbi:hypothetical protein [Roseimaritima multifibrata]|uniref:hypothetical protein n=1 Tax=Roseimaritima multifibrata TaxID=1930274 RepID=UPI001C54F844|nr:hypothetical protein [Roseimaritima multifibrata]